MSAARNRWLDEGVEVLMTEGFTAIRIDRLAARLGLSKGSFHHHFQGAEGYKTALLEHLEGVLTSGLERVVAAVADEPTAKETFTKLTALMTPAQGARTEYTYNQSLELALRAWALADPEAAAAQAAIDAARVRAITRLWLRFTDDEREARKRALLPYVLGLGATVMMPPLEVDDITDLFMALFPLLPDEAVVDGESEEA